MRNAYSVNMMLWFIFIWKDSDRSSKLTTMKASSGSSYSHLASQRQSWICSLAYSSFVGIRCGCQKWNWLPSPMSASGLLIMVRKLPNRVSTSPDHNVLLSAGYHLGRKELYRFYCSTGSGMRRWTAMAISPGLIMRLESHQILVSPGLICASQGIAICVWFFQRTYCNSCICVHSQCSEVC